MNTNPEISILKMLLNYQEWNNNKDKLDVTDFPKELKHIYSCINTFHGVNTEQINLSCDDLSNLVFSDNPKDREYTLGLLEQIKSCEASETTTRSLVHRLHTNKALKEISISAYEAGEGKLAVVDFLAKFKDFVSAQELQGPAEEFSFVDDDLEVLVSDAVKKSGLRWRLSTLNKIFGSLRLGDFGFLFARPETGKTTFLASEVTYMAEQLTEDQGPILWINNEEQGSKVMLRCYQASLGIDLTNLYSNIQEHKAAYTAKTHNKIKIYDGSNIHRSTVEKLVSQLKPSLIIFDQIDKIVGFDSDREDLKLGAIYQWARELAKSYCPVIAVCQSDGSGEGVRWLTMANVANAKTAKQAEADWILGIGKINEPGYENLRYLHASKNKLMGDSDSIPDLRHGRCEVLIDANIARYKDLQ
jgi:replicative DNA helicase